MKEHFLSGILVAAVVLTIGAAPGPAHAQQPCPVDYPPGTTLTVAPGQTVVANGITLTAQGFVAGETVNFELVPAALGSSGRPQGLVFESVLLGSAVADASGTAVFAATAPTAPGLYTVVATGTTSGRCASASLVVTASVPVIVVSNPTPPPGGTIQVSVAGFCPNSLINITLIGPSGTIVLPPVTAGPDGSITFPLTLPNQPGDYTIQASDTVCTDLVASTSVRVSAGPIPPAGSNTGAILRLALIALATGGAFYGVAAMRRRKPTPRPA